MTEEEELFLERLQSSSFAAANQATAESYPAGHRLSGRDLARVLRRKRYVSVATTRPGGRPHLAMSSFLLWDDELWLPATPGTQRSRNLRARPAASLLVSEGEGEDHVAILIEGEARIVPAGEADIELAEAWTEKFGEFPQWAGEWIVVSPRKLFSYAAEAAGTGGETVLEVRSCRSCGDTFPTERGDVTPCPSCGSGATTPASEPFL